MEITFITRVKMRVLFIGKFCYNKFMTLLDGKNLSQKIFENLKKEINESGIGLGLAVINIGENTASQKFIAEKEKKAKELGVGFEILNLKGYSSYSEAEEAINNFVESENIHGIVVQLPLPEHLDTEAILKLIPEEKDPDLLSPISFEKFSIGASEILPPVAGAVREFFSEYGIDYKHGFTIVVGQGRLVGRPVAAWLKNEGATFAVVDENTKNAMDIIKSGDIVISGVGKPNFIGTGSIKDGVVIIDAGASESEGKLVGDVDFDSVASKASFITPVPGGVGPVTVAMLFSNLFFLAKDFKK